MDIFRTEPIILSEEQFIELSDSLRRPNKEYMNKRDEIFARMDEEIVITKSGMDMEVEISGLDLSFIDEKQSKEKYIPGTIIELTEEFDYIENDIQSSQNILKNSFFGSQITVNDIMLDCSNGMDRIEMNQCGYNQTTSDKLIAYVKGKDSNEDMQSCKIGQILYAA